MYKGRQGRTRSTSAGCTGPASLVLGTCQSMRLYVARVGQVLPQINTSQTVLKSLRSVDLFDRLWRGAS